MVSARFGTRLVALVAVTLFGVGACALESSTGSSDAGGLRPVGDTEETTGASASPTPQRDNRARPSPTKTRPTSTPTASPAGEPARRTSPKPTPTRKPAGCPQGERQREVEGYLARLGGFGTITVDGRQSAADCEAIKRFQRRYDIRPAHGRAGPLTAAVARRLAETDTDRCRAGSGTTFCVDLTRQTVWAVRNGRVVMPPTVTRTGMRGYATPAGTYTINFRNVKEWSDPYEVWLPYWQRFVGGIGFHQTTTYLHDGSIGSHGCVNLLPADARRLWSLGTVGTRVHVFGRRPGT
ncbi:L,D-transpeptidase family protein [Micromonospora sp. HM5-17]|uniref:L,D-transpeptidase family protein n=1 Tax=Micromonospora sp. HM5-17 TaxID=2487710 RepID=UPI000F46B6B5|nr:L,D-transpeptidase family protein [Micromonospora sp. HM5-17]ROT34011.1 murein L,D-transpeptidase [Micromonospora sp. HM5-17]